MATTPKKKGEPTAGKTENTAADRDQTIRTADVLIGKGRYSSYEHMAAAYRSKAQEYANAGNNQEGVDYFNSAADILANRAGGPKGPTQQEQVATKDPAQKKKRVLNSNLTGNAGILGSAMSLGGMQLLGGR